jgi:hypothetical protein
MYIECSFCRVSINKYINNYVQVVLIVNVATY